MTKGNEQFEARVARMVSENNLEALQELHTTLTIIQEKRRVKFSTTRDVNTGKLYRVVGVQLGIVNDALRELKSKQPIDEAGAIGAAVSNVMRTARDRALYHGAGSQQARGRLDLGAITQKMLQNWGRYVGHSAATGDKHLKNAPTWGDLIEFLNFAYGIKVDTGVIAQLTKRAASVNAPKATKPAAPTAPQHSEKDLQDMITKQVADWDNTNTRKQRADDLAKGALSKTSPEEYDALKKKFGKVPNYPGKKVGESVINELDDAEEENNPAKTVFDPHSLFPILADFLLKKGYVRVRRGNETYGAKNGADDADEDGDDGEETPTARETPDGHTVDIDKMNKYLTKYNVSAKDLNTLKSLVLKSTAATIFKNIPAGSNIPRTLSIFVFAVLRSVVGKNDVNHDKASRSVTKDGNIFDINIFMNELKKRKVLGDDLKTLLGQLKGAESDNLIKTVSDTIGNGNSRQGQIAFAVASAGLKAIVKDQNKNKQAPTKGEPEPAEPETTEEQ
jgi:hypothetical protein